MAKYNKLAGKHIVVIGGTRGIGRGVVEASLESGARVTLAGSSQQSADKAVSSIKAEYNSAAEYPATQHLVGLGCDLSSQDTAERALDDLLTRAADLNGEIDHVVYTAADSLSRPSRRICGSWSLFSGVRLSRDICAVRAREREVREIMGVRRGGIRA